jgi:hypothetical protein
MQTFVVNLKGAYHNLAATPPPDAVNGAAELGPHATWDLRL